MTCGTPGRRLAGAALALLATALVPAGCSDGDETFTYIDVTVTINRQSVTPQELELVAGCDFEVRGVETPSVRDLSCPEGLTPYELGIFQWTTTARAGLLQFFVRLYNANRDVVGAGESPPIDLTPGGHIDTAVTVNKMP